MQDNITKLCTRLVVEDDPSEFHPLANKLQCAIHERVERVRGKAIAVAFVDHIVDWQPLLPGQVQEESAT